MIKLLFAGDVVVSNAHNPIATPELTSFIKSHDLACVDIEAPETAGSAGIAKFGPHLRQASGGLARIAEAGFTLFHAANNHIADFGQPGITDTIAAAGSVPILGIGHHHEDTYKLHLTVIKGRRFGFLSFAEWGFGAADTAEGGGFAWVNHPSVGKLVRDSRSKVDVLIVQVHAGVEEVDIPLPEWRTCYRELIDQGANVVIAHHPHVTQGTERYGRGMIFYSLGNFLLGNANGKTPGSYGAVLSIAFDENQISESTLHPLTTTPEGVVSLDERKEARDHIAALDTLLGEGYEALVDRTVTSLWQSRYRHFYQRSLGGFHSVRGFIKTLLRAAEGETVDYRLLSHNLNIESHRFVAMRLSKLRSK